MLSTSHDLIWLIRRDSRIVLTGQESASSSSSPSPIQSEAMAAAEAKPESMAFSSPTPDTAQELPTSTATPTTKASKKLSLIPLIFLIYFEVAGGPFGEEPALSTAFPDWNLYFNTLFWNLNFWDSVSTLAGEVEKPQKTFPLALFCAVIFTCVAYLIPLFAITGAVSVDQSEWESGFFANAAAIVSGKWLKVWIEIGAVLSSIGLFEAQLSSCVYQLVGMADLGLLPRFFAIRSKCLGMLLEFASYLWLRRKQPTLKRPYRVPMRLPGLIIMCLIPSGFLIVIMAIATKIVYLISGLVTVFGIGWYYLMKFCKKKKWFKFSHEFNNMNKNDSQCYLILESKADTSKIELNTESIRVDLPTKRRFNLMPMVIFFCVHLEFFLSNYRSTFEPKNLEQKPNMGISHSTPKSPPYLLEEPLPTASTTATATKDPKKLALIPLIFLIYFEVAGGPYGEEQAVGAAGPLLAILGFLIFPFIWSIPEALFLCGVINIASYPVLCVDYLKLLFPIFSSGLPRYLAVLFSTLLLSFLNYTGLSIVGYTAVSLGIISLSPFLVLTLISIPKIEPIRWLSLGEKGVKKDWTLFFNTLFWNLNFWDSASTLAGEVDQPQKTFPKALFSAGMLVCLAYLIPLLAATGAIPLDQEDWVDGYFANVAQIIAGKWLKVWVEVGAVLSTIGLFEAQLSSCAYQLLGMADLGFVPRFFGVRSTCLGMLLEFASFLWLRRRWPAVNRPYKVPMGLPGLVIMCLVPSGFLVFVMAIATKTVCMVSGLLTLVGIFWYFLMNFCKSRMWLGFDTVRERVEDGDSSSVCVGKSVPKLNIELNERAPIILQIP
ncbi:unnamed protein product, partial [Vitis vinifera]